MITVASQIISLGAWYLSGIILLDVYLRLLWGVGVGGWGSLQIEQACAELEGQRNIFDNTDLLVC